MSFLPARKAGEEGKVTEKITLGKDLPDKGCSQFVKFYNRLPTKPN